MQTQEQTQTFAKEVLRYLQGKPDTNIKDIEQMASEILGTEQTPEIGPHTALSHKVLLAMGFKKEKEELYYSHPDYMITVQVDMNHNPPYYTTQSPFHSRNYLDSVSDLQKYQRP
jgi:hypothetical protein